MTQTPSLPQPPTPNPQHCFDYFDRGTIDLIIQLQLIFQVNGLELCIDSQAPWAWLFFQSMQQWRGALVIGWIIGPSPNCQHDPPHPELDT